MKILCFGDSNTYGYDPCSYVGSRYPSQSRWVDVLGKKLNCEMVNAGENGCKIPRWENELLRFDQLLTDQSPVDLLVIMLGINDLLQNPSVAMITARMEFFLQSIHFDKNKILLIGLPPLKLGEWVPDQSLIDASIELKDAYKDLAQRLGTRFADAGKWDILLAFDGVHFTKKGNITFADGLYNYLKKENSDAGNWNEST